jgi:coenzyme PQQ precursor peptide PqqA
MEMMIMAWKTPKIVEVALGAEINCYACAELPAA